MTGLVEYYANTGKKRCACQIADKPFVVKKIVEDKWRKIPSRSKNPSIWRQMSCKEKLVKETRYHVLCPVCGKISFVFSTKKALTDEFKKFRIAYQMEAL